MKKRELTPIIRILTSLIVLFFTYQISYSQCPVPTNVDISVGKCASNFPKVNELSATGSSPSSSIEWFSSEIGGTPINPNQLLETGIYWVQQTIDDCISNRVSTSVTIYSPEIPSVNINQTICYTTTPTISDLSTNTNGIIWYDNDYVEGSEDLGTPLSSGTPLIDGKTYWASQYNFPCETVSRIATTVQLEKTPNAGIGTSFIGCEINLAASTNLFSLLSNDPDNNGTWTDPNGASHSGIFIPGNINGTYTYTVVSNSDICQDAKSEVIVTINSPLPPIINETTQEFCALENATIADLTPNTSNITWYDSNGNILASNSLLVNGEVYSASQTEIFGSENCKSLNKTDVTVIIYEVEAPIINETEQFFCESQNATIGDLIPNTSNINWYDSEGNILNSNTLLVDGEIYSASQIFVSGGISCESTNKTGVTVTILYPLPPNINKTTQSFCGSENATIGDLIPNASSINWYDSEGNILNSDTLLEDGKVYSATQTEVSGTITCESLNKTEVTVIIHSPQPPNNIETAQSFCKIQNAAVSDLSPNDETINWYDSNNNLLSPSTLLTNDTYYCSLIENFELITCESLDKMAVDVTIIEMQNPTATSNQIFCFTSHPTISNLEATGNNVLWFENENDDISLALNPNQELENNKTYWAVNINEEIGCESPSRISVTALINDYPTPTTKNISQSFCSLDNPSLQDLDINELNILWYDSISSNAPLDQELLLENQKTYYASQINDETNCESSSRLAINVTLINVDLPSIIDNGNEFCKINQPTLSDLNAKVMTSNNEEITWYDSVPNGLALNLNERLIEGDTYYAVATNLEGCQSTPLEVTVTLESCNDYDIKLYDGFSPNENGKNDLYSIGNLKELYPDFEVEYYNRWGKKVFTSNVSKPSWNGRLNGNGKLLPTGVYYCIIYFNKDNKKPIQHRLYLSR